MVYHLSEPTTSPLELRDTMIPAPLIWTALGIVGTFVAVKLFEDKKTVPLAFFQPVDQGVIEQGSLEPRVLTPVEAPSIPTEEDAGDSMLLQRAGGSSYRGKVAFAPSDPILSSTPLAPPTATRGKMGSGGTKATSELESAYIASLPRLQELEAEWDGIIGLHDWLEDHDVPLVVDTEPFGLRYDFQDDPSDPYFESEADAEALDQGIALRVDPIMLTDQISGVVPSGDDVHRVHVGENGQWYVWAGDWIPVPIVRWEAVPPSVWLQPGVGEIGMRYGDSERVLAILGTTDGSLNPTGPTRLGEELAGRLFPPLGA
jgi:hypothetical protein